MLKRAALDPRSPMYTVADYGRMAADAVRMDAYQRAIRAVVRPGSVVLDLGAGTGIMSFLALRAGAARVHAVDPNPAVLLIPELAKANGVGDRIVVHQASSLEMDAPERVDVVVADMRGSSPLLEHNLEALRDARTRWLKPDGVLIPCRDRLKVVLVEAEAMDRRLEEAVGAFEKHGIAAEAVRQSVRNQVYGDAYSPVLASDMLSSTATWATLEYGQDVPTTIDGEVGVEVTRGGIARGLVSFFDAELAPGVTFTTAPGHAVVYHRLYLPLREPMRVSPGDRVRITLRADRRGERWAWDTTFERDGSIVAQHRQATFLGAPATMTALLRSAETSTPSLGRKGELVRDVLCAMDGTRSLRQIADEVGSRRREPIADVLELARSMAIRYGA